MNIPSLVKEVFPVGIYYGNKKPNLSELFMEDFEEEIIDLIKNGIIFNGKKINICLRGICCDSPAKAFLLGIKSHTGYFSCTRCQQAGQFYENRLTFTENY